ncbi:Gfo/Idh/MocA family protein [Mucilaginibacter galii]|uniref:Glucose-fructose oxidoreductase n=1 Tax=Mucilaginibacter galii TaxID=2005073 RepID=A0A917J9V9_9SPHI|nr:Gfo/Idh/MocA family oxidoreductase [Mucilaginibacter galii]GGI50096.1 glucose-fructose oxidoreductase [Mucilaginibacter galii]
MKNDEYVSRRGFIRTAAIGAGALTLSTWLPAYAQTKPGKKLGIALVGLGGYSSGQLAPALQQAQHCYLAGIVTGTPAKATEWAQKYNIPQKNIYNYENFDSIKNNPDIDIVYVVLPVSMHKEYTIRAAQAGKHVICEKPMALNVADCQEMINACKKANRMLSIGYRLHFDPYHQEVMRLGQKQVLGALTAFEAANGFKWGNGNFDAWRLKKAMAGGGGLMDMGVYTIQAARYTTGKEPIAVTARQEKLRPDVFKEVDETVYFELEFPDGLKAKCQSSYNNNWSSLKATTQKGSFGLDPGFPYNGIKGQSTLGPISYPPMNQQAAQMDDFAQCVNSGKATRVPGEEGLKDMKVVEAIYRSLANGGKRELV